MTRAEKSLYTIKYWKYYSCNFYKARNVRKEKPVKITVKK